jgi:hypothetical protein
MKQIYFLILISSVFLITSCNKRHPSNRDLKCFDKGNPCTIDSQFVQININPDQNCIMWDGVNVKNVSAPTSGKVGDSIAIKLDAIAITNGANGSVLFATAQDDNIVEIKTFLQYNICAVNAQVLNNVATTYYFVPKQDGNFHFTFINVYGDRTRLTIPIKK